MIYAYNHSNNSQRAYNMLVYYHKKNKIFNWSNILLKCTAENSNNYKNKDGKYWIETCIDNEPENEKEEWFLEEFMKKLLK